MQHALHMGLHLFHGPNFLIVFIYKNDLLNHSMFKL